MHFRKSILILSLIGLIFLSSSAIALQSGDFTYTLSGSDNDTTPTTSHALTEVWILTAMSGYPTSNLWIGVSTDGLTFQNIKSDGTCAYTGNNGYGVEDPRIMYYTYGGNMNFP